MNWNGKASGVSGSARRGGSATLPREMGAYSPLMDLTANANLGVHEHWCNSAEKLYSRNLGKDEGIELVRVGK